MHNSCFLGLFDGPVADLLQDSCLRLYDAAELSSINPRGLQDSCFGSHEHGLTVH